MRSRTPWIFITRAGLLLLACSLASCSLIDSSLNIKNADRTIDLHSQITKITNKLVIENTGKSPVHNFIFALDAGQNDHLRYISALLQEHGRPELKVKKVQDLELENAYPHKLFYQIELSDPLQPKRSVPVEVRVILTNAVTPHPKEILQNEKQLVKYTGNLYLFSPYSVTKQTTNVLLPSRNVESYTKTKLVTQSDSTITCGPFEKKSPFAQEELKVHFENSNKFLTVTRLERVIEISHWGNIAVEETIDLLHTGASLKGLQ